MKKYWEEEMGHRKVGMDRLNRQIQEIRNPAWKEEQQDQKHRVYSAERKRLQIFYANLWNISAVGFLHKNLHIQDLFATGVSLLPLNQGDLRGRPVFLAW